jgi:phage terminase small subunit
MVLLNPKHERFAQELAQGKTADEAYRLAGYKENRGNASTLKANQIILDRVAQLLERGASRVELTVQAVAENLLV